jgi:hypothetical protein
MKQVFIFLMSFLVTTTGFTNDEDLSCENSKNINDLFQCLVEKNPQTMSFQNELKARDFGVEQGLEFNPLQDSSMDKMYLKLLFNICIRFSLVVREKLGLKERKRKWPQRKQSPMATCRMYQRKLRYACIGCSKI